jgi:hypothetical protein
MTLTIYDSGAGAAAQEQQEEAINPSAKNVPTKSFRRDILEGISISLPVFTHLRGKEDFWVSPDL